MLRLALHAQSGLNFANAVAYDSGGYRSVSAAVADVNRDGEVDLIMVNLCVSNGSCDNGSVSVLLGNGDGTFQKAVTYNSGGYAPSSVAVADVNGDGNLDVLVANQCASLCPVSNPDVGNVFAVGSVGVLLGKGDGTFQPVVTYSTAGIITKALAVADVNGDGRPDIIVTIQCAEAIINPCVYDKYSMVDVLLGNGNGTFRTAVTYSSGGSVPESIVVQDINGDGKPDIVVSNQCASNQDCNSGGAGVLFGNGDGTFQTAVTYNSNGVADSVAVADVNGDGNPDLIVGNYSSAGGGTVAVMLGNGDGTFGIALSYFTGGYAQPSVAVADINGGGALDLLVASQCFDSTCSGNGVVGVLLGKGDGTFQAPVIYGSGGHYAYSLAVADVNGDTKPDLLITNETISSQSSSNGVACVLINETVRQTGTPTFSPSGGTYTRTETVTISDSTPGAMIYYTTNGTTPTTSSTKYTGSISVTTTKTIEAMAVAAGYSNSAVASARYVIVYVPS